MRRPHYQCRGLHVYNQRAPGLFLNPMIDMRPLSVFYRFTTLRYVAGQGRQYAMCQAAACLVPPIFESPTHIATLLYLLLTNLLSKLKKNDRPSGRSHPLHGVANLAQKLFLSISMRPAQGDRLSDR